MNENIASQHDNHYAAFRLTFKIETCCFSVSIIDLAFFWIDSA